MIPQPEVRQVDRDAAASTVVLGEYAEAIVAGRCDDNRTVQAFARCRAAAFEAGRSEGVREAAEVREAADALCRSATDDCTGKRIVTVDPDEFDRLNKALDANQEE